MNSDSGMFHSIKFQREKEKQQRRRIELENARNYKIDWKKARSNKNSGCLKEIPINQRNSFFS